MSGLQKGSCTVHMSNIQINDFVKDKSCKRDKSIQCKWFPWKCVLLLMFPVILYKWSRAEFGIWHLDVVVVVLHTTAGKSTAL